eukprot:CAMPEP_0206297218 /NCGR_PEP_ID=MMETSP0106_2-20121207/6061_1 /ASSEMBLY_ACC=CAM_ASM_000206 /TAXON_ID=81532 /ORGANISM="Acanthoeca-like sp., Strain 10tr" /LENGTH=79 /DNA_ID=CAMNT_0053727881 /DNA_START=1657 /DNA_END=1896 /DNA_ORIENTATION=+
MPSPPAATQASNAGIKVVAQSRRDTLASKVCRIVSGPPCTTRCLQPAVAATQRGSDPCSPVTNARAIAEDSTGHSPYVS